jgi:hypothetical protein
MVIADFQVTRTMMHLTLSKGTLWMMTISLTYDLWYILVLGANTRADLFARVGLIEHH